MVLLWSVGSDELHHPGVRIVLVKERYESHVSEDTKVSRASPQHSPEQFIIRIDQLVRRGKLAADGIVLLALFFVLLLTFPVSRP